MTKYCDVHGAVEVNEGVSACPLALDGLTGDACGTRLKATPEALVSRGLPPQGQQTPPDPTVNTREQRDRAGVLMRQGSFLSAYQKTGRISKAAELAEVDRGTHYDWLKNDPDYSRAFEQARKLAFQTLADEAWRRAMGENCAQASDRLMIKLLESLGPATGNPEYGPAVKHEHSGPQGKPIDVNISATEQLHSRIASLVTGAVETPGA